MATEQEFKNRLKPFLEMVKSIKQTGNNDFLDNIEEFKNILIKQNIGGIKENPFLLDKFIDEIIENQNT